MNKKMIEKIGQQNSMQSPNTHTNDNNPGVSCF